MVGGMKLQSFFFLMIVWWVIGVILDSASLTHVSKASFEVTGPDCSRMIAYWGS